MENKAHLTVWSEFFADANVRFPKKPKLIDLISIYDAPYGLGIQFRGGPNKFVIRGKNASKAFSFVRDLLKGQLTLDEIFDRAEENDVNLNDIASVLRILHANHLLIDGCSTESTQVLSVVSENQLNYYNRIVGKTGFNKSGSAIQETIATTKVLLIASENLVAPLLHYTQLSGLKKIGVFSPFDQSHFSSNYDSEVVGELMTVVSVQDKSTKTILNDIQQKLDDYQYVIIGMENPSTHFLIEVNRLCLAAHKPAFYLSKRVNSYEIGPYVIPYRTACYSCYNMRKNSYNQDAVHENIYQDQLKDQDQLTDKALQGDDLVSSSVAVGILMSEFVKAISGASHPALVNQAISYDFLNGQFSHQVVMRAPGCPDCSRS